MKPSTRSALLSALIALILTSTALLLPSSAEARHYAWSDWSDRTLQVKARRDMYFTPGTTSVWQFQRNHRQTGKRQVRVVVSNWYFESDTFGPETAGAWKGIRPGAKVTITGPLVYGCFHRDGHGYNMVAQVRKKVHGTWSAPREITSTRSTGSLGC